MIWDSVGNTPTYSTTSVTGISGSHRMSLSATLGASAFLGNYTITESNLNPVYEARAIMNTSNATTRAIVGFTDRAQNAGTLVADTNNSTNEIFFRKKAATLTWETVTRSTANATEVVTATAIPVNQWNIFRIEVEGSKQTARFYINGTLVATHNGTTIPASGIRFGHQVGMYVSAATANSMDLDYIRVWSDDPAKSSSYTPSPTLNNSVIVDTPADFSGASILPTFINTSKQYLGDVSFILSKMGTTDSGSIAKMNTLNDNGTVTIEEYGNYILNNLKQSLEKLSGIKIDTILNVQ